MTVQIICLLNFVIGNQLTLQFEISDNKFESKGIAHLCSLSYCLFFASFPIAVHWPLEPTRTKLLSRAVKAIIYDWIGEIQTFTSSTILLKVFLLILFDRISKKKKNKKRLFPIP